MERGLPTYQFADKKTGEVVSREMRIAELDDFAAANPHLEQVPCAPLIVDAYRGGHSKTHRLPDSWKEVLRNIKKSNAGSVIDA